MKVKQTIFVLTLSLLLTAQANAQDTFSFSGLSWNDSITTVNKKLKVSGGDGLNTLPMISCFVQQLISLPCTCGFNANGLKGGSAYFDANGLSLISLVVNDPAYTKGLLVNKYGQPQITKEGLMWQTKSGESIKLHNVFVTYSSGRAEKINNKQNSIEDARF